MYRKPKDVTGTTTVMIDQTKTAVRLVSHAVATLMQPVIFLFPAILTGADPEVLLPGGTAFVAEFRQTHYIFLHCRRYTFICIRTRQY